MICSSVCLLRFIVWSFLKARLQFILDQFNGATSVGPVSCAQWPLQPSWWSCISDARDAKAARRMSTGV
jgi:hypothetical protein